MLFWYLFECSLSGTIPVGTVSGMRSLQGIDLDLNPKLSGTISMFFDFPDLLYLNMKSLPSLSGTMPSLGAWHGNTQSPSVLQFLDIHETKISGSIPELFCERNLALVQLSVKTLPPAHVTTATLSCIAAHLSDTQICKAHTQKFLCCHTTNIFLRSLIDAVTSGICLPLRSVAPYQNRFNLCEVCNISIQTTLA